MNAKVRTFKMKCEPLSPIHIGSGNEIDPLDYTIVGNNLYVMSFGRIVAKLNDDERAKLEALIDKGDLLALRSFITKTASSEMESKYSVEVSSKVRSLYDSKIGDIQNQLLINPFIRTEGEAKPFVPGSSIKGAIRTAIISEIGKNSKLPKPRNYKDERQFESKLLGCRDAKEDPFRGLTIRDISLEADSTIIREIRNVSKTGQGSLESNELQIICEVTHSSITGKAFDFETQISIDQALFSIGILSKSLTIEQIIKSCTAFYRDKMTKEHNKFYANSGSKSYSVQLLETPLEENSFLLRIGRFSGVESVTIDKYRNPRPPGKKRVWGTTKNLAEGKYPMGWLKASISEC